MMTRVLFVDTEHQRFSTTLTDTLAQHFDTFDIVTYKSPPFNYHPSCLIGKIFRLHLNYMRIAVSAYFRGRAYDVVISWNGVVGLYLGLLKVLFPRPKPRVLALTIIVQPRRRKAENRLRHALIGLCLRGVDWAVCHSRAEAVQLTEAFRLESGRVRFVAYGIDLAAVRQSSRARRLPGGPIIVSAGKSNRDYATLITASAGIPIRIIMPREWARRVAVPDEQKCTVDLRVDVPYDVYLELLDQADIVVVPIENPTQSSGQLVILHAMALGKSVIATRTWGTEDYIEHSLSGLLTNPGDATDLRQAMLCLLNSPEERSRIGENAARIVKSEFSIVRYASNLADIIIESTASDNEQHPVTPA